MKENQVSKESFELFELLTQKQFTLEAVGLSSKNIFDWQKKGILWDAKPEKGRRRYNSLEYVWLKIVMELREFGMPHESISNLKSFLLKPVGVDVLFEILVAVEEDTP
jgi:DNA-binding transcriptional MerR regulator